MKRTHTLNRRQFIGRMAGAAAVWTAAPTIIPSSALGLDGTAPPSERIVFGCIGLGGQGRANMRAFIHQPDTQIVALCDVERGADSRGRDPARQEAAKQYAEAGRPAGADSFATYSDFRELLARDDIDAVTVCTPDHWHGLIAAAAARAGKDIYCEKPLTNTVPEGRAVCDAVERHGRVLQTGSHERSNDSVRFAYELVRNGRIGELKEIRVHLPLKDPHHMAMRKNTAPRPVEPVPASLDYDFWLGPAPAVPFIPDRCHMMWRFASDYGGGEITDRGAHILDIAQFINDADLSGPTEIEAHGTRIADGVYDAFLEFNFECRYPNGVRLLGVSEEPRGLKLVGTKGWIFIHIHGGRLEAEPASLLRGIIRPSEIHTERSPGHHRNFLDCVKSRRHPIAWHEIGHRTASLCQLVNIALTVDRPLVWDPVRERITNDPMAARLVTRPMRSPWKI